MNFTARLAPLFFLSVIHAQAITVTNTNDSGAGSLRQALVDAPSGDVITFEATLDGQTLTLSSGQLVINSDLSIDASALANGFTIDANASENDRRRVLLIESDITASFTNLTFTGGWTADGVDGLEVTDGPDGSDASIGGNADDGGGIYINPGCNITITDSTVSNNRTGNGGRGGDHNEDSFTRGGDGGNSGEGGGIFVIDSQLNLFFTTVSGNQTGKGGDGGK